MIYYDKQNSRARARMAASAIGTHRHFSATPPQAAALGIRDADSGLDTPAPAKRRAELPLHYDAMPFHATAAAYLRRYRAGDVQAIPRACLLYITSLAQERYTYVSRAIAARQSRICRQCYFPTSPSLIKFTIIIYRCLYSCQDALMTEY